MTSSRCFADTTTDSIIIPDLPRLPERKILVAKPDFLLQGACQNTPTLTKYRRREVAERLSQYPATLRPSSCQVLALFRQVTGIARPGERSRISGIRDRGLTASTDGGHSKKCKSSASQTAPNKHGGHYLRSSNQRIFSWWAR